MTSAIVYAARAPVPRRARPPHSQAPCASMMAASTSQPVRGRKKSAATTSAMSTAAVRIRVVIMASPRLRGAARRLRDSPATVRRAFGQLLAGPAEAALALAVPGDRPVELARVEIGPQRRREVELGVGELPEHEVADALLAAGADEQVGLGRVAEREVRRELLLGVALLGRGALAREPRHGLEQVPAAAVVGRDGERQRMVGGGELLGAAREVRDALAEGLQVADHLQAHAVRAQLLDLLLERRDEQLAQHRHFLGGPAPVLRAEGEQRE